MFSEMWKSFLRSWSQYAGTQFVTLTVLSGTFTICALVLILATNLNFLLTQWGDSFPVSVYLEEDIDQEQLSAVSTMLTDLEGVQRVEYVSKEEAFNSFQKHMSQYAPDLVSDEAQESPFPASFMVYFGDFISGEGGYKKLQIQSEKISAMVGVEEVSYGQGWLENYSAFVSALSTSGGVIIFVLIAGALFVIANSIRHSISSRREEIEILELVGATKGRIRMPYLFEGMFMGLLAAATGLLISFFLLVWAEQIIGNRIEVVRIADQVRFLSLGHAALFVLTGALFGALAAYITIRQVNDGWAASQRVL